MKCEKPMTENEKIYGNKLYNFLKRNGTTTKDEMFLFLGWSKAKDRQLRDLLSNIAKKVPLISLSDRQGYKIAKDKNDLQDAIHAVKELESRISELKKRKGPLMEFIELIGGQQNV